MVLPLAAEHDVARVLRYEMDRLTPFTAEQVYLVGKLNVAIGLRGGWRLSVSVAEVVGAAAHRGDRSMD